MEKKEFKIPSGICLLRIKMPKFNGDIQDYTHLTRHVPELMQQHMH